MTRRELLAHTGSIEQVAGIHLVEYQEGRAFGLRAYEVHNGPMRFSVLADKCLDIGSFSYRGIGFNFLSKPGLQGRNPYDTRGSEAQRSIMGGLMFTAGLENIGAPCVRDGREYPMHGRLRTTPAGNLGSSASWLDDDTYELEVTGDVREAELFGENFVLHRTIRTRYGTRAVTITDTITNEAFREEPYLILYHINLGFPFLEPDTHLYAPSRGVRARDRDTASHEPDWNVMESPAANEPEYVFFHELVTPDSKGIVSAVNEQLGLGFRLSYTADTLPVFTEWKSRAAGDYALGLEPSNASVLVLLHALSEGTAPVLGPLQSTTNELTFTVLEGEDELRQAKAEADAALVEG